MFVGALLAGWTEPAVQAGGWHIMPFGRQADSTAASHEAVPAHAAPRAESVSYRFQFRLHAYLARFYALRGQKRQALRHLHQMLHMEGPDWRRSPNYDTLCIARDREVAAIMAELGYYDYAIRVLQSAIILAKVDKDPQLPMLRGQLITLEAQYKERVDELPATHRGDMKLATLEKPAATAGSNGQASVRGKPVQKPKLAAQSQRRTAERRFPHLTKFWAAVFGTRQRPPEAKGRQRKEQQRPNRQSVADRWKPAMPERTGQIRQASAEQPRSWHRSSASSRWRSKHVTIAGNPPPSICLSCLAARQGNGSLASRTVAYSPPVKPTFKFKRKQAAELGNSKPAPKADSAAEPPAEHAVASTRRAQPQENDSDKPSPEHANSGVRPASSEGGGHEAIQASWQADAGQKEQEHKEQKRGRRWLGLFRNPLRVFRSRKQQKERIKPAPQPTPPGKKRAGMRLPAPGWLFNGVLIGRKRKAQPGSAKGVIDSAPKVAIIGQVARPGLYRAKPEGVQLKELIEWAGGLTVKGRTQVTLIRTGKSIDRSASSAGFDAVYYEQLQADASEVSSMLIRLQPQEIVIIGPNATRSAFVALMPQFVLELPRRARPLSAKQISALIHKVCPASKGAQVGLLTLRSVPDGNAAEQEYDKLVSRPLRPGDMFYIDGRGLAPADAIRAANAIAKAAGLHVRKIAARPIPAAK